MAVEVKLLPVDKIKPNPYQVREDVEEDIDVLVKSIKSVDLLQPISVRPKDGGYEIIAGERRWRAAKKAGLKEIPAIVKKVDDARLVLESLIENVHRKDLSPIAKAKGLYAVYQKAGFSYSPSELVSKISGVRSKLERKTNLSEEEKKLKETADLVSLDLRYQEEILQLLKLSSEEQKKAEKLEIAIDKLAPISRIEKPEIRKKLLEIAPKKTEEEIHKIAKLVREAPKPLVKAVLKEELEPEVAEKLIKVPESKIEEAIKEVKALRLKPEEAEEFAEAVKTEVKVSPKQVKEMLESYREFMEKLEKKFETPEFKKLAFEHRNLSAHWYMSGALEHVFCPVCGADWRNLVWKCHNLTIKDAIEKLKKKTKT